MADKTFDLGGYVEVKDRLAVLYELFPQARVQTSYELTREPDDEPKVICRAMVYRTPEDAVPASGTSWMYLPGKTTYTRGSEIENAETSAVGRAIGMLGILIDRSIASANEVESKKADSPAKQADAANVERLQNKADEPELIGPLTVTGALIVNRTPPSDGLLRQTPEGAVLVTAFDDTDNKSIPQVVARGALAVDLLDSAGDQLNGLVCTISGDLFRVPWKKNGAQMRPYQRLELHRIETAGWTLPVPIAGQNELFHELTPAEEAELDALAGSLP